jgi:hypothetical protein
LTTNCAGPPRPRAAARGLRPQPPSRLCSSAPRGFSRRDRSPRFRRLGFRRSSKPRHRRPSSRRRSSRCRSRCQRAVRARLDTSRSPRITRRCHRSRASQSRRCCRARTSRAT